MTSHCFDQGSCGLETRDVDEVCHLTVYFADGVDIEAASRHLREHLAEAGLANTPIRSGAEPERDWSREWRRFFKPVWASSTIVVHPSWIPVDTADDQIAIVIDPEMAFGTGGHESTQLCLQAISDLALEGRSCFDLGTGSGILAIAAALLGAAEVLAVDVDAVALENARQNIEVNLRSREAGARIQVAEGSVEVAAGRRFDLVFANLEARLLSPLLSAIRELLCQRGVVLFSGLLQSEREVFEQDLERAGLVSVRSYTRNDWLCCAARLSRSAEGG